MICCSIIADTKEKAIQDLLSIRTKADIVEIRLDYLNDLSLENIKEIISMKMHPVIMTCREKKEGGNFEGSKEQKKEILKKCIELNAEYIDIELSMGEGLISDLVKHKKGSKIIVSYHNFKELPEDMGKTYEKMKSTNCDIIKIACMANSITDNLRIFELIKKAKQEDIEIIAMCMGEKGEISRILNLSYGSFLTYGSIEKGKESAPGQISCEFLKRVYRADKLNDKTKIYGLIGNPVSKSRGFIVHNLVFKEKGINAVYLNFLVEDLGGFIKEFKPLLAGLSVTMPLKQEIIKYLDDIDKAAKKIGAVNTVVIKEGKLIGYNTDIDGALEAIKEKIDIKEKNILLLGAGGAARAIGYGIITNGGNLIIANRTEEKGKKLAAELNAQFKKLEDVEWRDIDLLINTTSLGMAPKINESPIGKKFLKNMVVFDTIYSPLITKMLDIAEKNNCIIISGIRMFIFQAAKQFELWTGKKADIEFMEQKILEYIPE